MTHTIAGSSDRAERLIDRAAAMPYDPHEDVQPDSAERLRIQDAVGDAPLEADLGDGPAATVELRRGIISSLVEAAAALQQRYDANARA